MALARKPFVVIDAEILSSTVWAEPAHVRLVWITLLILCDTEGYVGAAIPGIARAAGVTLEEARDAMERLQQPDPDSRTKTNEGIRVVPAERGWRVLNFVEHVDRLSSERVKARERLRRFRERKRQKADRNVSVRPGNREQGAGNRDVPSSHPGVVGEGVVGGEGPRLPANPLIAGRRPQLEQKAYELIRAINDIETDRDPTEILIEAAGWKDRDGNTRTKVRVETMRDDHLIRTVHDLKTILEDVQRKHGTPPRTVQQQS